MTTATETRAPSRKEIRELLGLDDTCRDLRTPIAFDDDDRPTGTPLSELGLIRIRVDALRAESMAGGLPYAGVGR